MEEHLSEHNFKASDQEALKLLKELFEFTTPFDLRKSLQATLFTYLKANKDGDAKFEQVINDFDLLIYFLDGLDSQ